MGKKIQPDPIKIVDEYVGQNDWRARENSNVTLSIGGLILSQSGAMSSAYWLDKVYSPEEAKAHQDCDYHLHDLNFLGSYCSGWSIKTLLEEGLNGVDNKVNSSPAKHLNTACHQIVNFLGILQNEAAGAQAFSSFDTYLAPFIVKDNMTEHEVNQALQNFCWDINTPFLTSEGKIITFKEAEENNITNLNVYAYDETNKCIVVAQANHIGKRHENTEMISIELEDGTIRKCDTEQPLLTSNRGWVKAKDLTEDDDLLEVEVEVGK